MTELELFHKIEYCYWYTVANRWKRAHILSRLVLLDDIERCLRDVFHIELPKEEIFNILKEEEERELKSGHVYLRVGAGKYFEGMIIPVDFYRPITLSKEELKKMGLPVGTPEWKQIFGFDSPEAP